MTPGSLPLPDEGGDASRGPMIVVNEIFGPT